MSAGGGTTGGRAVCAGCGCLCDDLPLDAPPYERGRAHVETGCALGRAWFASRVFGRSLEAGPAEVAGEPAELPEAAARAAALLRSARRPLVAGIGRLSLEAQRRLVEVADRIGADLAPEAGDDGRGTRLALHRDGGPFVTLGEVRERADCLVLWYLRPGRTHPRLLERFYPAGRGDGDRTLVAVGPEAGETDADLAVPAGREDALRLLWLVRLLAEDPGAPEGRDDPLADRAAALLERLRDATWGAWMYPGGGAGGGTDPVEVVGVLRLLARLGDAAPWGARPVRGEGNPVGAETVTTWQTGYPGPVSFREGVPRYDGGGGRDRDGTDAVLLAGGRPGSPDVADGTPCVWLDAGAPEEEDREGGDGEPRADVRIPILPAGVAEGDTLLRMDGLPVRSPGVPGAEERRGVPAEAALEELLAALGDGGGEADDRTEEAPAGEEAP